jgi:hypothetical protein
VRVEITDAARKEIAALYGPLASEGFNFLKKYTTREIVAVVRYLEEGQALQRAHAQRIRRLSEGTAKSARRKMARVRGSPTGASVGSEGHR